ncbi:MAG TPA: histidine phosphatase family protein [Homoserinimonas sp.]|nr:histidine phosphatase family protein [Homoserinimonas sp.]
MTYLYLVRHGETDWNRARRIQGTTDIQLNETGREQARATGRLLARRHWDGIVTSPLSRAAETARIIAEELGLPEPTILDALAERNYGEAEGLTGDELLTRFPGDTPVAGREPRSAVADRVMPTLVDLAEQDAERSIIVVSHGGVIRTVLKVVGPDHGPHHTDAIPNGSVHSLRYIDEVLELVAFDDPIEIESVTAGSDDFPEQNPMERRES